ncbi:MAG: YtxH domain-containing protein, partial [Parachlamydia sp.]|nr:YtxH domain-containing protein [Parachlamydia sp.]
GFETEEEEYAHRDLIVGGIVGGIIGAAAGLLLAPKPGSELREDLADRYEDFSEKGHEFADQISRQGKAFAKNAKGSAGKWASLATDLIDEWTDQAGQKGAQLKGEARHRMNDIAEWASLGYRVWQEINKRK